MEEQIRMEHQNPNAQKNSGSDANVPGAQEAKTEKQKRPRPDPNCPICYGQGLKAGNFTGDLVNCDCMDEDE